MLDTTKKHLLTEAKYSTLHRIFMLICYSDNGGKFCLASVET